MDTGSWADDTNVSQHDLLEEKIDELVTTFMDAIPILLKSKRFHYDIQKGETYILSRFSKSNNS